MAAPSYSNEDMMAGNENGTSHNNNNTTGASSAAATLPLSSVLEHTYTSLIQQYLAVHCLDNATFYAERLVATSKTSHSLYLLALCYYRHQKPQRVRYLLEQEANTATSPELMYLLAQSCFDQEDYSAAEEALLRQVRRDFSKTESSNINEYILTATVSQTWHYDCSITSASCRLPVTKLT
jgi:lipopolysaccharide biosynthesis regulator YciM